MIPRFTLFGFVIIFYSFISCSSAELDRVTAENDSLRNELERQHIVMVAMNDVKVLLDSIDASRHLLRLELHEGTPLNDVTRRLEDLNGYVKKTESVIESMKANVKEAKHQSNAYLMMVLALKDELSIRADEIESLASSVRQYELDNKGLVNTVKLQEQQVTSLQSQIAARQQELALLENKIKEMIKNFQLTEAEAVYARAKAVEEAANRTKLAPRKKKETYKEALDLYKKALSLGKEEAQKAIAELEKKVK